jgi:hypothetical protein
MSLINSQRGVAAMLVALTLLLEVTDVDLSYPLGLEVELFGVRAGDSLVVTTPPASTGVGPDTSDLNNDLNNESPFPGLGKQEPDDNSKDQEGPETGTEDDDCSWACMPMAQRESSEPLFDAQPNPPLLTPPLWGIFHPPPVI